MPTAVEAPTLPDSLSPTLSDLKAEARGTPGPPTRPSAETQYAVMSWVVYLKQTSVHSVVATGGGLAKTAVKPAVWYGSLFTKSTAFGSKLCLPLF